MVTTMKKLNIIILSLLCFLSLFVHSQNAPVTSAGIITDASPGDDLVIPVTVSAFNDIGTITLTLDYNPAVLTYLGSSYDPLFLDMVISNPVAGRISVGWYGTEGITLPDGTAILEIYFDYISGSSNLTWFDNGGTCEYLDGNLTLLNDSPTSQYYINGHVTSQAAPITHAPTLTNTSPGSVAVPVTVEDFVGIGTLSLTLEYDPLVLTYVSKTYNAAFDTNFIVSSAPSAGGKYKITIGWWGLTPVTLNSGGLSTLVTLNFTYTSENGLASSELNWLDIGGTCEYSNALSQPLWDSPTEEYYTNGLVTGSLAPITHLVTITSAVPGPINIPVTVDNFTNIAGISLTIEYDPDVMTYTGYTNAISGLSAGSQPLPNGNRKITIGRFGGPVSLTGPGALLVNLQFTFISGTTLLTFLDDGSSCEYTDPAYNPLYDLPYESFYDNGLVTGQLSPKTYLPVIVGATAGDVWVPVTVDNFTNIGSLSLTFEYDPSVITYTNVFTVTNEDLESGMDVASQAIAGGKRKITIGWWGLAPVTLTPTLGSEIVSLKFTYTSGTSPLTWNDNGGSCEYSDANYIPLFDLPTEDFYSDGLVAYQLSPVIKAGSVTGSLDGTVTVPVLTWGFTDINSISLTLDFNPDVLTFDCIIPNAAVEAEFGASDVNPGRLEIGWFGSDTDLPDGSVLFYITFIYHGGTTDLTWFDDGATCSFTAGPLYLPLYDLPTEDFYEDGIVLAPPAPAVWTGTASSVWNNPANWQANIVPDSFFDVWVDIDPAPPVNWPVFPGDFTVGESCKSLTLKGAVQMEVQGNLNIMPGKALVMNGAGLLKVGGDWNNYGVFTPSTGTVEFTGTVDCNIDESTYPATALSAYTLSTFSGAMTALVGGSVGPTGDNAHSDVNIGFTFNYLGVDYTQLRINTNGWVSMNLSGNDAGSEQNNKLFFTDAPGTALAPWWDNLLADGSSAITYQSSGGVFTVEWKNILAYYWDLIPVTTRLNFQLKLYEGTNVIEFWYGTVSAGTHSAFESASIGIKDATGGTGRFIEATTGSSSTAKACLGSETNWPTVNYRYSPPSGLGTENFWKIVVSKTDPAKVNVKRDVNVLGL
jgi:hypothetical protein